MDPGYQKAVRKVFVDWYDEGPHLPRQAHHQLVSSLLHGALRHRGRARGRRQQPVAHPLSAEGGGGRTSTTWSWRRPVPRRCSATRAWRCTPTTSATQDLVGATVVLPLLGREIPIVADEYVDPSFGTGAVKVTPAHDPNDFEIAERHDCEKLNIFTADATVNENGGPYAGLDRYEARKRVVADLDRAGAARQDRRARPLGGALLPLPHGHRAVAVRPVVRGHEAAGRAGDRGRARRPRDLPPEAVGERLLPLDGEHPRLVHLAAAVVGPPDPGVLLRRVRRDGRIDGRPHRVPDVRRRGAPGRGRARHVVLARSCGRSRRSAGPSRRPSWSTSIRPPCSPPRATSCSCGSRA